MDDWVAKVRLRRTRAALADFTGRLWPTRATHRIADACLCATCLVGVAAAQIPPLNVTVTGHWDGRPDPYAAADVWGDSRGYAYVGNRTGATVDIMDMRDASHPQLLTVYEIAPPNHGANTKDVKVHEGLMFIGMDDDGNDGVQVVDVRDPADPRFLVNVTAPSFDDVHNMFYDRGYLYVVNSQNPLIGIVDLTRFDPDAPPAGSITVARWVVGNVGTSFVHDVTVVGDRLYASAWDSGIWIYDISNIENESPVFVATAGGDNTHAAWATRDGRWVVTNEERSNGGPVKLYEFTNDGVTQALTHVFTFSIPTTDAPSSHNVYVVGYRAYCAWYNRGLMAFDIDPDSRTLSLVAHFDTSVETLQFRGAWGAYPFLGDRRVLFSDKSSQFWVFDVRVPESGDIDGDADRDLADFSAFLRCLGELPTAECEVFDSDGDADVDLDDYGELVTAQTGPR